MATEQTFFLCVLLTGTILFVVYYYYYSTEDGFALYEATSDPSRWDLHPEIRQCAAPHAGSKQHNKTFTKNGTSIGNSWSMMNNNGTTEEEDARCGYLVMARFYDKIGRLGNLMFGYAALYGQMANGGRAAGKLAFMQRPVLPQIAGLLDEAFEKLSLPIRQYDDWWYENKCFTIAKEYQVGMYESNGVLVTMACDGKNIIIYGLRQSFKYFSEVPRDEIRREFTFKAEVRARAARLLRQSLATKDQQRGDCVLVGAHMRRGDFTDPEVRSTLGLVPADENYLQKAVAFFTSVVGAKNNSTHKNNNTVAGHRSAKLGCLTFLIFGNDYEWNLKAAESIRRRLWSKSRQQIIVVENRVSSSAVDLCALSMCDHVIISTGSFSWWAGFLNRGTVTYQSNYAIPGGWYYSQVKKSDYFLPDWIAL